MLAKFVWNRFLTFSLVTVAAIVGSATFAAASNETSEALGSKVKEIVRARCLECHGGSATQAGIDVLNVSELRDVGTVVPGEPDASLLYQVLVEQDADARMPLGSLPLNEDEIHWVRKWIVAGASDFPEDVVNKDSAAHTEPDQKLLAPDYLQKQILEHQRSLSLTGRYQFRYFSSHHHLVAGATKAELQLQRDALFKAINHLSRERELVKPITVNSEVETLFAVDLRDLGWHRPVAQSDSGSTTGDSINKFDLVQLEYPYGVFYEDSATFASLVTEYLEPSGMVRPIPYLRIDWFVSIATLPPLYHDLLQLPLTLTELEEQLDIDTEQNIEQRIAKRAGMAVSGVSRNNRAVERHPSAHGAYWKSIDYATSKGTENIFTDPINLQGVGGEMIFNLPNGLQAYYVADGAGQRLDLAPTSIVTDKFAEDKTVRNGLSCIRCHDQGMKDFRDDVRPSVERIQGSGLLDKRVTLELYPSHDEMADLVRADKQRFVEAIEQFLGERQDDEPLTPVSRRFLDSPLQLSVVAGELGLLIPDDLRILVRQPQLTGLGLVTLANAGVVRRDMWEDYFDQVVTALGLGIPVIPIDGLTRPAYIPKTSGIDVRITTTSKSNVFAPADELLIFVENKGQHPVFIELFGRSTNGEVARILKPDAELAAGETLRFPESGKLKVKPRLGKEEIILFASESEFAEAEIFRGTNVADRIVHKFYQTSAKDGFELENNASEMVKRTLVIETR